MSSHPSARRRTTAAALLAATLGAAVPAALVGGQAPAETVAAAPAAAAVLSEDAAQPAGTGAAPVHVPPADTARADLVQAPVASAASAPADVVVGATTGEHVPQAREDGLTGPADTLLSGTAPTASEPVRVVAQTTDETGRPDWQVFEAASREEALAAVEAARAVPEVELVAVDTEVRAFSTTRYNDTYRSQQWALDTLRGEASAAASSGAGVTVAVLDTGVRADHEDFAPGTVLTGRSYVSDSYGAVGNVDPNGHGTHVAGIIAAARDNARGVAGLSSATILPMRVLGAGGSGSSYGIASAIRDSVDLGADVVNMSLGGPGGSGIYDSVVEYARSRGVVVVAAAGNSRQDGDPVNYPGAAPGVLTVASSNVSNVTSSFSSTGPHVEVAAPGEAIASLGHTSATSYVRMSGTSMATPYTSAAAAMLLGARPDLTPTQVESALMSTARDIEAPGRDVKAGAGVIDPLAALQSLGSAPAPTEPAPTQPAPPQPANQAPVAAQDAVSTPRGTTVTVDVRANDSDPDGDALTVTAVSRPGRGTASLSGGTVRYTAPSGWTGTDSFTYTLSDGRGGTATGRVTVTVTAKANTAPLAQADAVTVRQDTSGRIPVLGNDRDDDGDRLRVMRVGAAASGTTRISSGTVVYTPRRGFSGADSFTYEVSDGRGGTATGTVSVTVQSVNGARRAVNRAPKAVTDKASTTRALPVTVPVLGNDSDPDGDDLTLASVSRARRGTVALVDGAVVYSPAGSFTGTDSFTYRVADGKGGSATGRVTVRVSAAGSTRR
jgi:subtilisin family serine protease